MNKLYLRNSSDELTCLRLGLEIKIGKYSTTKITSN